MFFQIIKLTKDLIKIRLNKKGVNKILLVGDYFKTGGARTYLFYLLEFFYNQNLHVTYLVNADETDIEINAALRKFNFEKLEINFDFWCIDFANIPKGLTKQKLIIYQLKELRLWSNLIRKYKFTTLVFSVCYPEQYLYAFLLPVNIRYILHTAPVKKADKFKSNIILNFLSKKKQLITVSHASAALITEYWLKNKPNIYTNVIHNFYEPRFKGHSKTNQEQKNVLTIGSVEAYKNPFFFIDIAKKIIAGDEPNDIVFTWAGDGSLFEECIKRTAAIPQIRFIGHVENVEELYASSSVYFQPSLQESFGIAVLGAMFHKLPCIVSDNGGMKELVESGVSGYVFPLKDKNMIVESIIRLLNSDNQNKLMGEKGFMIATSSFTKEAWNRNMNNVFKN